MRTVNGYLCLCHIRESPVSLAFGPGGSPDQVGPFYENGMQVWRDKEEAIVGSRYLMDGGRFRGVSLFFIHLRLAESRLEAKSMQGSQNLIVVSGSSDIALGRKVYGLYGANIDGRGPIPALPLEENGWHPFDSFKDADYAAGEIARQTLGGVMLGDLIEMTWLSTRRVYPILPSEDD